MNTNARRRDKTRRALNVSLNGEIDDIHAPVRRGLVTIAEELDEHAEEMRFAHEDIIDQLEEHIGKLEKQLSKVTTLLSTVAVTLLVSLGTALLNVILN